MYPILDTRVECKGHASTVPSIFSTIRIEPDWNVKWYNYASNADNNTLE